MGSKNHSEELMSNAIKPNLPRGVRGQLVFQTQKQFLFLPGIKYMVYIQLCLWVRSLGAEEEEEEEGDHGYSH